MARTLTEPIVKAIKTKGASLECTEQPLNTGTAAGKAFLDMLGVFATSSRPICARNVSLRASLRQKAKGVYKGRKPTLDPDKVRELADTGMARTAIAKQLGMSRRHVYRLLGEAGHDGCDPIERNRPVAAAALISLND